MSNVLLTVTVFHTLAAITAFGFMVYSVVKRMQGGEQI